MAIVYHDEDGRIEALRDKTVAVIGYGNQGRSQALNLRDSGLQVIIGNREDEYAQQARADGFAVHSISAAAGLADVLLILIPDEVMPGVIDKDISPRLKEGACVDFASGYCVGFGLVQLPASVDVVMIAPRMIGPGVRERYLSGEGFPSFVAVHQDYTGRAKEVMLGLAKALGTLRSGGLELTMRQEAELDLFTEQGFGPAFGNVLMNSVQLLVDAGYPVEAVLMELFMSGELAYSLHKMTYVGVVEQMDFHSHTSQYGSMTRAGRFADLPLRERLAASLEDIRSGRFVEEWRAEQEKGAPLFHKLRELRMLHPLVKWQRQTREAFRMKTERGED